MPRRPSSGPRYATVNYTVAPRGEHGCAVLANPASAAAQVACYRDNRPDGAVIDVTYSEHCGHCRGAGRVPGKRRLSWQPCKACGGEPELFSLTLDACAVADLMRRYQSAWLTP